MKLVTFLAAGAQRLGAQSADGRSVVDLQRAQEALHEPALPCLGSMQALIEAGEAGLEAVRHLLMRDPPQARLAADAVHLLSPLPIPMQVRDFMCFELHVRQASFQGSQFAARNGPNPEAAIAAIRAAGPQPPPPVWFSQPVYYKGNRFAIAGTGADIDWPAYSRLIDYELEMAAVIGRQGRNIAAEHARDYIFGYTIYNDFSARDAQFREMAGRLGPAKGKDFDGGTILGPCIVTADELTDPYNLSMVARVNTEVRTDARSSTIHWTFEQMIAHVSQSETIYPGEVFGSGTVGNGCGMESWTFLNDGDVVELTIEGIGTVRNRINAPHLRRA